VNSQKDFLDNIFRLGPVPDNLVRQIQYGPKKTQEEKVEAILAAVRDIVKHRFIGEQPGMLVRWHFGRIISVPFGLNKGQHSPISRFIFSFP